MVLTYSYNSAATGGKVYFRYDRHEHALGRLWYPVDGSDNPITNFQNAPVLIVSQGQGWVGQQFFDLDNFQTTPTAGKNLNQLGGNQLLYDRLRRKGWVICQMAYPYGTLGGTVASGKQTELQSQRFPASKFPGLYRVMAKVVQHLKSKRTDPSLVPPGASLGGDYTRYATIGSSAGAVSWLYIAHQPVGAFPFASAATPTLDPYMPTADHRVRAVINFIGNIDFGRLDANPQVDPYIWGRQYLDWPEIPQEVLDRSSSLRIIEQNLAVNKTLGVYSSYHNPSTVLRTTHGTGAAGAWTQSTKQLTQVGGFSAYTFVAGDSLEASAGTPAVTVGKVPIQSKLDNDTLVLAADIHTADSTGVSWTISREPSKAAVLAKWDAGGKIAGFFNPHDGANGAKLEQVHADNDAKNGVTSGLNRTRWGDAITNPTGLPAISQPANSIAGVDDIDDWLTITLGMTA